MSWMRTLAWVLGAWVVSGCSQGVVDYPPLHFTQYQPIQMAVSNIEFDEEYKSSMQPPYVEHLIPYSPAEAMRIWVHDRLRASGGEKTMRVIIKDGSVKATELPHDLTITNVFSSAPDKRYDATLTVELRIYGDSPIAEADTEVTATRSLTMPENASVATRQAAFRRMMSDLMDSANAELEKNIYQYLGNYVSYSQTP